VNLPRKRQTTLVSRFMNHKITCVQATEEQCVTAAKLDLHALSVAMPDAAALTVGSARALVTSCILVFSFGGHLRSLHFSAHASLAIKICNFTDNDAYESHNQCATFFTHHNAVAARTRPGQRLALSAAEDAGRGRN
jgi:hypothetical protein